MASHSSVSRNSPNAYRRRASISPARVGKTRYAHCPTHLGYGEISRVSAWTGGEYGNPSEGQGRMNMVRRLITIFRDGDTPAMKHSAAVVEKGNKAIRVAEHTLHPRNADRYVDFAQLIDDINKRSRDESQHP